MSTEFSYPELVHADPKAAVLVMFTNLEGLLKRGFRREYPNESLPSSVDALTKNLAAKGVIGPRLHDRLDDLRKQRNRIVHDDPLVSVEEADKYYESLGTTLIELVATSLFQ